MTFLHVFQFKWSQTMPFLKHHHRAVIAFNDINNHVMASQPMRHKIEFSNMVYNQEQKTRDIMQDQT